MNPGEAVDRPDTASEAQAPPKRAGRPTRPVRVARHMSDAEALMWNLEKDPLLDSSFGTVTLLDRVPDPDRMRRRVLRMVAGVPRLRQRVVPVLGRLAPPEWRDDPDFDLDFHLRRVALPAPGDLRTLLDLATQLVLDPFDRTRPLWEFVVVEGLDGDRAALVQKMHHTITDGEGGIRMSELLVDLERDPTDEPAPFEPVIPTSGQPESLADSAMGALGHGWRRTVGATSRATSEALDLVAHPDRIPALAAGAVGVARSAAGQLLVADPAHSPLWVRRSLHRRLDVLTVDFDDAYTAAKTLGGSLNDLFLTAAAHAAGAYHRELGKPVESLRVAMPVSMRSDRSAGGNSFAPVTAVLPTAYMPVVDRFTQVHEVLHHVKGSGAAGAVTALAGFANLLPTSALVRIARRQVETVDFTASNVRAAPFELYIAGGCIEGTYPLGPLGGTSFNVTMMSYRGKLDIGVHVDTGAVAEPERLVDRLSEAFAELATVGPDQASGGDPDGG
jgi:WS/DGAT/MGAT family acyltransferase